MRPKRRMRRGCGAVVKQNAEGDRVERRNTEEDRERNTKGEGVDVRGWGVGGGGYRGAGERIVKKRVRA